MKAIIYTQYGSPDVLQFKDVEKPTPNENEVLVKIHAASANALDWHFMRAVPFLARLENGLFKPKETKLGSDLAGTVEAVGSGITQFQPGDEVIGNTFGHGLGAFAEYVCVSEDLSVLKPPRVSFESAAAVPTAALTALQGLRDKGQIKAGQKVLINGASGGVGTFAVQIAKASGAEVTGVCSTQNLDMVRSIGHAKSQYISILVIGVIMDGSLIHNLFLRGIKGYLYRSDPLRDCLLLAIRTVLKTGPIYRRRPMLNT